jgi:PAS domain S-box-containing protein
MHASADPSPPLSGARPATGAADFRAIAEDLTELISQSRRDGTLTYVNPACAAHFGLGPAQMLGRGLHDFVDAAARAPLREHLAQALAGSGPCTHVDRMRSADGRTRWVAWTHRALRDADGRPVALQSVGRDITTQRLAESALADSRQRYDGLYEATPAALHSIDAQGRLLQVSDRWLAMLGYEREEVLGRTTVELLSPESAQRARDTVLPEFFRTGRCDRVEYQFLHKDGRWIDVLLSALLERDDQGRPLRTLAVLEDVTTVKWLTAELGRTHADLHAVVDNVPALLGRWDEHGVTRFANPAFQAAVGLPMERIVGQPLLAIWEAIDPLARAALQPRITEVLQGQRQDFELPLLTTVGLRQLRMTLVPDQPDGRVAGFYGMAHDITGRKALELRLLDSERRYRSLFDHLNSGFALHELVLDAEGQPVDYRFLAMNVAFESMTGIVAEQAIGRCVSEVLPGTESEPANWVGVFGRVALTGEPQRFEQRSAALGRWYDVAAYRPAPGQFAVLVLDITPRKQAEARLAEALSGLWPPKEATP